MRDPEATPTPSATSTRSVHPAAGFELAPPRRFVLPALLLLLSEQPGHGYSLEKGLRDFRFGQIDRPTVYRALAHLEADGLVESWYEPRKAAQPRRVYRITPLGERVLGVWMSVIKEERDDLGRVLRRYQATGTTDAMLAEVEGGWAAALGSGWSPVSPTSAVPRHVNYVDCDRLNEDGRSEASGVSGMSDVGTEEVGTLRRFHLLPERSVVLIDVRSTVGPISFGALGVAGTVDADIADGAVRVNPPPTAHIEVAVDGFRSGNGVYDAELLRRVDVRRFPLATLDLRNCTAIGSANRFRLGGQLTFHGVTRAVEGTVDVAVAQVGRLVISGEQVFDIRDFAVPSPTMLMFRIYPDVRVRLHVEAEHEEA
jgi:DNA-binding PadR family transcriptional regulator